jgi:hypothetical protein
MIVKLKEFPELLRVVRAADPSYRKHQAIVNAVEKLSLGGSHWSGGSRSTYTAVNLVTMQSKGAPQYDPPQFGGPKTDPIVSIPEGAAIVATGVFCGKTATATVYLNPANMAQLLPAP